MAQWTIGKKIGAGFCLVLLQACAVGAYALWMTTQTSRQLKPVSTEYLPETELAAQIEREFLNARINFIYFVTVQKEGSLDKGWQRLGNAEQQLPKLQELVGRSEAFASQRPDVEQLVHDFGSYKPVLLQIIDVVKSHRNKGPEFAALLTDWARLGGAMVDSAGRLSRKGTEAATKSAEQASSAAARTTIVLAISGLAGLVLGLTVMIFVTRNIARGLREVTQDLGSAAQQVESGATQIAESSQSLARGASDQAASLEETSASGEEINSMANRNAGNSKSAAGKMVEASQQVGQANVTLGHMVESMNEINASSGKISKIIKVIDEIAFQTNILALNAAVEAARAGEAGMGFAVVADEVRNLAQRSAQAARDTAELIEESISKSADGKNKLNQVTIAVSSITESANQVKVLVEEVRLGSDEQAKGIAQVAHAIAQMEKITQTTAASAEESASAAEELSMQSGTLRTLVERLNGMVGGSDHRTVEN